MQGVLLPYVNDTMSEITDLTELEAGDKVHITLESGKTIPLTVGNVRDEDYATLQYDGQNYANLKWAYEIEDADYTLITIATDDEPMGVTNVEMV